MTSKVLQIVAALSLTNACAAVKTPADEKSGVITGGGTRTPREIWCDFGTLSNGRISFISEPTRQANSEKAAKASVHALQLDGTPVRETLRLMVERSDNPQRLIEYHSTGGQNFVVTVNLNMPGLAPKDVPPLLRNRTFFQATLDSSIQPYVINVNGVCEFDDVIRTRQ